ncbi:succinate--CoA ligase [Amycolatopsis antarctica]|uniref:Succinate--CoA ligase n=1 Tax=Amycolatopsis antarctica TaxID=1854586 RepID=A0A263CZS9_9PSEU|nr:ATP-grasp domain-containing protein [Amycolatopsis antarctica]OZM71611.1 succinate--CoA ligase [Amycolatopsis antarctica]
MKLLEHQGKQLLAGTGIAIPKGRVATTADDAAAAAVAIGGRVVLKSQIASGKRGKSGGILFADDPETARTAAAGLLGSEIGGHRVGEVLVEQGVGIETELYAAVLNDPGSKGPLVLFSTSGGMDIEETGAREPGLIRSLPVDIRKGLTAESVRTLIGETGWPDRVDDELVSTLLALYRLYRSLEADLVEVNPLVVTGAGDVLALDAKISLDPGALVRHAELSAEFTTSATDRGTELEERGKELGLQFIELDGSVGILANGAGLTMTTLDAVHHFGGRPANFLEIGGDAYTKATPALRLVLDNPRVRSLLVNFCGAFARTDVMTEGVVNALEELRPDLPVFFSIHGTGEAEAIQLVSDRLGDKPYDRMDDAVRAAVQAAQGKAAGE